MNAAAHDPEFAAKVGIPVKVAKEFHAADKMSHPKMLAAALAQKR